MANSGLKFASCLCGCLLVIVNNLAIIIGLLLLAVGVVITFGMGWITQNSTVTDALTSLSELLKNYLQADINVMELVKNLSAVIGSVGVVFIVLGVAVVLLSCIGCFGACCKYKPCLMIYVVIVAIFFIAQLTVVIIWFANSETFKSGVKGAMESSVKKYTGINSENVESLLQNAVQIYVGCCGVNNGTDFHTMNQNWNRRYTLSHSGRNYTFNLTYPVSCCQFDLEKLELKSMYCPYNNSYYSNHKKGCYTKIFTFIENYFELNYIFYALAGILGLQALLIAGALIIYCSVDTGKQRGNKVENMGVDDMYHMDGTGSITVGTRHRRR